MLSSCLSWFLASLTVQLSHGKLQIKICEVDPDIKLEGNLRGSLSSEGAPCCLICTPYKILIID